MKKINYDNLKSRFEAYEYAREMRRLHPENPDIQEAAEGTWDTLLVHIRFILWDEAPEDIKPLINPDELPF